MEIQYEGRPVAVFYLDLFVAGMVVVEAKAFPHQLTNDEIGWVINYLKATAAPVGLLLNFGRRALEYRRNFPPRTFTAVGRLGRDNCEARGSVTG